MLGSLAFLLLALLACMALALGVIAFFAIDAVREGRRFLNASGERIVAQAVETSSTALGKGRDRLGSLMNREGSADEGAGRSEESSRTEGLGAAIRAGRERAAAQKDTRPSS